MKSKLRRPKGETFLMKEVTSKYNYAILDRAKEMLKSGIMRGQEERRRVPRMRTILSTKWSSWNEYLILMPSDVVKRSATAEFNP